MRIHPSLCILATASIAAIYWPSDTRQHAVPPAPIEAPIPIPPPRAATHSGHTRAPHLVSVPVTPEGRPRARNSAIERALEEDEPDPIWTSEVDAQARERLAADPALHIDALHCTRTFCRIQMTKPVDSSMDWEAVDHALTPIARGETIFGAERNGAETTGFIYFAALGSNLPVDRVHEASNPRGNWSP